MGASGILFDLIYRYEEAVFDPDDPAALNLASVVAAQVALNYGLFCREIVFRGPFDRHDRKLLIEMAANTAREIYVKKFLEPNPFLVGKASSLSPEKRDNYLVAELVFPDAEPPRSAPWETDRGRCVVLSSGGKESLLSHGLLDELGVETHPIFVNESGRHWFTALNAYRHFSAEVPRTSRVWTNSDRVFSWMLRHLPFVREDFANGQVRRVSDQAVDRGGLLIRRVAVDSSAGDRPAGDRRRVRHDPALVAARDSALQRPV